MRQWMLLLEPKKQRIGAVKHLHLLLKLFDRKLSTLLKRSRNAIKYSLSPVFKQAPIAMNESVPQAAAVLSQFEEFSKLNRKIMPARNCTNLDELLVEGI